MAISVRELHDRTWELSFTTTAAMRSVFEYVLEFERHVEWEEQLLEVKRAGRSAGVVGAKYIKTYGTRPSGFFQRLFWTPIRIDCTIKAVESPHRMRWQQQLWRDQPSDSYDYQEIELRLTPDGAGSRVAFLRHLSESDASSASAALGLRDRFAAMFDRVPPEMQEKLRAEHRRRYPEAAEKLGVNVSGEEVAGDLLEKLPIRGPGSRSLARLKAILDTQRDG
jgi:hypothetical protein